MNNTAASNNKMRISFDLDEVLFVDPHTYRTEKELRFPLNKVYRERLREGTVRLIHQLQIEGFEVWVYTSSFRPQAYIQGLFRHYGVHFDQIVNAERHLKEVQRDRLQPLPQKLPNHYHIALHIDDEDVVVQNGRIYGFEVLQIDEPDDEWVEKVLTAARRIRSRGIS